MKVLVIDDDVDIRRIAHYALSKDNINVVLADNGIDGIEKAHDEFPDAILLDLQMPDVDGATTVDALRTDPETNSIPIILLTGSDRFGELVESGVVRGVIRKPFDVSSFADDVRALLSDTSQRGESLPLEEVRGDFLAGVPARLEAIERALEVISEYPADPRPMTELLRQFHQLAGTAATCGVPAMSDVAARGERELDVYLREEIPPDPDAIARWRGLLAALANAAEIPPTDPVQQQPSIAVYTSDPVLVSELSRLGTGTMTFSQCDIGSPHDGIDALVVDWRTEPQLSNLETIGAAAQRHARPFIAIGPERTLAAMLRSIRAGASAHVAEPFDRRAIVERLTFLIDSGRRPRRVLYLTDDSTATAALSTVLESAGFLFHSAALDDTERALQSFRPDLALIGEGSDSVRPSELVKFIRMNDGWSQLPLVILRASPSSPESLNSIAAGADDVLAQTVSPNALLVTVSSRIARSRQLAALASRDSATGVLSHTAFLERLSSELAEQRRSPERAALLLLIDIDAFDDAAKDRGSAAADEVLTSLARLLQKRLRPADVVGRIGAAEFALLLFEADIREGAKLATRILREFSGVAHNLRGTAFRASFSAGIAEAPGDALRPNDWLQRATCGLDYAKREGGARIVAAYSSEELESFFADE